MNGREHVFLIGFAFGLLAVVASTGWWVRYV